MYDVEWNMRDGHFSNRQCCICGADFNLRSGASVESCSFAAGSADCTGIVAVNSSKYLIRVYLCVLFAIVIDCWAGRQLWWRFGIESAEEEKIWTDTCSGLSVCFWLCDWSRWSALCTGLWVDVWDRKVHVNIGKMDKVAEKVLNMSQTGGSGYSENPPSTYDPVVLPPIKLPRFEIPTRKESARVFIKIQVECNANVMSIRPSLRTFMLGYLWAQLLLGVSVLSCFRSTYNKTSPNYWMKLILL